MPSFGAPGSGALHNTFLQN